ncbi:MAG TPA: hypothetical protein VGI19_06420 [Candidatus Cybelea sp.]|jgi:hypothetical protein
MKASQRFMLGTCVAAAVLAACGEQPQSAIPAGVAAAAPSWMLPGAKRNDLLYVSYFYGNDVYAYTYPGGKLVGTLTGISDAQGECTSKKIKGNWWVVATGSNQVMEFAHGGTSPLATLNVTAGEPGSCAVDPKTGNVAVTMVTNDYVVVYKNGSGSGTTYTAPFDAFFAGYDDRGNLFVDGSGQTSLAELPRGGSEFVPISANQEIIFPGGVAWYGKYLAVGDQDTSSIYQFNISGTGATLAGTTALSGGGAGGFWIQKHRVISADGGDVGIWKYPAGGSPRKTIAGSFYGGIDTVISAAK